MITRPPASDAERKRELARERKRRQREREEGGTRRVSIYFGKVVIEALIVQSVDAGHTEDEATKQSRNRKKVAADLASIIDEWARRYLARRA